jgi:hypothetical protein
VGSSKQSHEQKLDVKNIFERNAVKYKNLDYIACWFWLAARYCASSRSAAAFVTTNSICQGEQVYLLWSRLLSSGVEIFFAHRSFKWSNLAARNAGVTCAIVGIRAPQVGRKSLFYEGTRKEVYRIYRINPYLLDFADVFIPRHSESISALPRMLKGNQPTDGGHLILSPPERRHLLETSPKSGCFVRKLYGSKELIDGVARYCIWIENSEVRQAETIEEIAKRLHGVTETRLSSDAESTRRRASIPHRFIQIQDYGKRAIVVPEVSSENRDYLPCGLISDDSIATNKLFAIYEPDMYVFSVCSSRLHRIWAETVCGRLEERISYSNVLGYNTFPLPTLTEQNRADLTRCAENILLAREAHFPATIADLYDPDNMPENLRHAHEQNDEVLERIYIGRRFRNDTERLEKLFEMYTKMTAAQTPAKKTRKTAQ